MDQADRDLIETTLDRLLDQYPPHSTDPVEFLRAQFDAGLAYLWFPVGYGGLEQPIGEQSRVDERLTDAGAPPSGRVTNAIAAGQGAASVVTYGSDDQKRRYLRPLFTAEMMGCQLYSEPGSGSDLASLSTRAERYGTDWVVNGQKVWTSGGHVAASGHPTCSALPECCPGEGYDDPRPSGPAPSRRRSHDLTMSCVGSPASAIAGGTDEIQRNIIGDRVLGLPREPAPEHGLPWSQTLRN